MSEQQTAKWRGIVVMLAVAAVAIGGFWWQHRTDDREQQQRMAQAQTGEEPAELPSAPSPTVPTEPPLGERPIATFPEAQPWVAGDVRGQAWPPLRAASNWLVVAPESGEDGAIALQLVKNLWSHRDIGVVVLATPATPTTQDPEILREQAHHRLQQVVSALATDGRMVVLLGSRRQGEAMLQMANDPKVLAIVALEPTSPLSGMEAVEWQQQARKKLVFLGGSEQSANAIDSLARRFPHNRSQALGPVAGLAWTADPNHRATLAGWLHTALGPPR